MKILVVSSEINSCTSSGGLSVATEQLAKSLARRKHHVVCATPYYKWINPKIEITDLWKSVEVPVWRYGPNMTPDYDYGHLFETTLPASHVKTLLIQNERHFGRPDLYMEDNADYSDNADRFAFFSQAALRAALKIDFIPDLIHIHDWQTGSLPLFLKDLRSRNGDLAFKAMGRTKVLWTSHNLTYHGPQPGKEFLLRWGLPMHLYDPGNPLSAEFHGAIDFLKIPIVWSDGVSTVSRRYLTEILGNKSEYFWDPFEQKRQEFWFDAQLCGVMRWAAQNKPVAGILNGLDECSPSADEHLGDNMFDASDFPEKKAALKTEFQKALGFADVDARTMMVGFSSRLDMQKGATLLPDVVRRIAGEGPFMQLVVYNSGGDIRIQAMLRKLQADYPKIVRYICEYAPEMFSRLWGAEDCYMMPSLFEPCGLAHRQAAHYGGFMIARDIGGLAETVTDIGDPQNPAPRGNGILFKGYNPDELYEALKRAHNIYTNHLPLFRAVQLMGIGMDDSWDHVVRTEYEPFLERVLTRDISRNPRY